MAREQNSRSWELRTATSLAKLWREQDKIQPARELLEPVYDGFGEGLDTPALQDAKSLLNSLR